MRLLIGIGAVIVCLALGLGYSSRKRNGHPPFAQIKARPPVASVTGAEPPNPPAVNAGETNHVLGFHIVNQKRVNALRLKYKE